MSSIRRRQIRFTVFLALIILACVTAGLIVRLRRRPPGRLRRRREKPPHDTMRLPPGRGRRW